MDRPAAERLAKSLVLQWDYVEIETYEIRFVKRERILFDTFK